MLVRSQPEAVDDPPDEVSLEMTEVKDEPIRFEIHYLGPENARLEIPVHLDIGKKQGYEFMALIDTGAHRSFRNYSFVAKYASMLEPQISPFASPVVGASGNPLHIYGQIDLPCTIGHHWLMQNFIVPDPNPLP